MKIWNLACVGVFGLVSACATASPMMFNATPTNSYRAYGEYHPASDDDAIVKRSETVDLAGAEIHLFQEALPPGIEMHESTFGVAPGYAHKLIGKYAYSSGAEQAKDVLVDHVKRMAVATNANAAVIVFSIENSENRDRALGIEAILIWLAPSSEAAPTVKEQDHGN